MARVERRTGVVRNVRAVNVAVELRCECCVGEVRETGLRWRVFHAMLLRLAGWHAT